MILVWYKLECAKVIVIKCNITGKIQKPLWSSRKSNLSDGWKILKFCVPACFSAWAGDLSITYESPGRLFVFRVIRRELRWWGFWPVLILDSNLLKGGFFFLFSFPSLSWLILLAVFRAVLYVTFISMSGEVLFSSIIDLISRVLLKENALYMWKQSRNL